MRKQIFILILFIFIPGLIRAQFIRDYKLLSGNNIAAYIINTGIADQNITINNTPGFEWPKGSEKFAIFTSGLTIAARVNGSLRMAAASYLGEYRPGYISNEVPLTDSRFHIFSIKRGDTTFTNPDYAEWGNMVPYGAPYVDVNNNGLFELGIDRPGVKDASQTIFLCMTDGFPESHTQSEGFGGGTDPLMVEVHFTAWCYDNMGLEDAQFRKWEIINKSGGDWNGAIFSIVCDPDLGDATDDRIGCDTSLEMGFCYNGDNDDGGGGPGTYGTNPPAVGISFLKTPQYNSIEFGITAFNYFRNAGIPPLCERDPDNPQEAYNYMKGLKTDGTKWVNPLSMNTSKFIFSGDPESGLGWNEEDGTVGNCGGDTTAQIYPSPPGDRRMTLSTSDSLYNVYSGHSITIVASQQITRGSSYLNSVTKLKALTSIVRNFWQTIGITPISSEVPETFMLYQNYPNPFNPSTKIRFEIPNQVRNDNFVRLLVYDITGREIARLVNQELAPGIYEYDFNGSQFSSGVYFYTLQSGEFIETKKMVLLK